MGRFFPRKTVSTWWIVPLVLFFVLPLGAQQVDVWSRPVQAETLRAVGRSGDRRQLPFLREALETPSHQDVIRQAAEWAIEELSKGK